MAPPLLSEPLKVEAEAQAVETKSETDNLDFYSALKYLASLIGLTVNNKSHQDISFQNKYKTLELSSKFFIETLNNKKNKNVLDYLNERGLNKEICH